MPKTDKISVLIVDDIADTRENLRKLLYFEKDIQVVGDAGRGEDGIQKVRELRPNVVLMDINLPGIDGIAATEAIRTQAPTTQVIMMSVQSEAEYLRRAMLAGAREFLVKPFSSEELAGSIRHVHELARDAVVVPGAQAGVTHGTESGEGDAEGRIVSVFSAKGGVGRTTVACNLAIALRTLTEKKVALVDGSLQFGDVGVLMNIQGGKTISDLAPHLASLETEVLEGILISHSSGVRVLLAPPRPEMMELIPAEAFKRILHKLRQSYDFVIVDTWPTFQDTVLTALDLSDRIILLFTLEMTAIKNVKLFLEVADALGYHSDKLLLAANRADGAGGIRIADVEESLRRRIPIRLVSDERLATYALNRGVPFVVSNAESPLAQGVFSMAQLIAGFGATAAVPTSEGGASPRVNHGLAGRLDLPGRFGLRRGSRPASAPSQ